MFPISTVIIGDRTAEMIASADSLLTFVIGADVSPALANSMTAILGVPPARWRATEPAPWRAREPELVLLAVGNGGGAAETVAALKRQAPRCACLVLLADPSPPELVRAVTEVADDFVLWPVREVELSERINRLRSSQRHPTAGSPSGITGDEVARTRRRLQRELKLGQLIGQASSFRRMVGTLPRLAQQDGTVLIVGETGSGKELCARAIHQLGPTPGGPFVAVDCGALPDQLVENELFGHARGAFTDARSEQRGLVGLANGGVLFLDEVDSLSLAAQAKLLRFLQEHVYRPLGSDRILQADVRVVAATNSDLAAQARAGRFRADLHYRLNVLRVEIPPLRDRPGDVALLAAHFLARAGGAEHGQRLSAAALAKLGAHDWPGNVRELENVVRRAVVAAPPDSTEIDAAAIDFGPRVFAHGGDAATATAATAARETAAPTGPTPAGFGAAGPIGAAGNQSFRAAKAQAIAAFERQFVGELMQRHRGNVTQAARAANKDRRALGRLVKKYRAAPPTSSRAPG
jgi:DNA-binding NtrC family response regulator